MKKYIGCDLGGTNLRAAIVDVENGAVIHQMSMPTLAREGHEAVMKRMADLFLQVIRLGRNEKGGYRWDWHRCARRTGSGKRRNTVPAQPAWHLAACPVAERQSQNLTGLAYASAQRCPFHHQWGVALRGRARGRYGGSLCDRYWHRRRVGDQWSTASWHWWHRRRTRSYDD